jgi:hypothetical protein
VSGTTLYPASTDHDSDNLDPTWVINLHLWYLRSQALPGGVSDGYSHGSMSGRGPSSV